MPKYVLVLSLVLAASCAAIDAQKAQAVRADTGEFHNLKVLPQNITRDQLLATMRAFTRSLGVRCDHCHAPAPEGSKEHFDFPSDAKPEKDVARVMLRMTRQINADYVEKVNEHGTTVTCYTCHRGKVIPDSTLPPLPEGQGQGAPPAQQQPAPQPRR
jgi:hypothetical protein